MKHRNIFSIGLALAIALVFTACSQEESLTASQETVKVQNGYYVHKIDLNCEAPAFDQQDATRAVSHSWQKGETLFARFKSGSTYYAGYIVCEGSDGWILISKTSFLETAASGTCELFFFRMNEDYYLCPNLNTGKLERYKNGTFVESTEMALDASTIRVTCMTSFYYTSSATYKKAAGTNGSWGVTATLLPNLWRMRFKGTDGTTITLPANDNDIQYCSMFNWTVNSPSEQPTFSTSAQDVNLTVSGGYTPYVYGMFSKSGSNKITVKNGNATYTRNISASSLPTGTSGYFDIPTESNYSSYGWTKESSQLFEEPYLNWGASKSTVKSNRSSNGYTLRSEGDDYLYYEPKYKEKYSYYRFESNELNSCYVYFDASVASQAELESIVKNTGAIYDFTSDSGTIFYDSADGKYWMAIGYLESSAETYISYHRTTTSNTTLFEEPYLNWGASMSTVKSNRSSNGYTLRYEYDSSMAFEPKYKEKYSSYLFDDTGGLYISSVYFETSTISFSELVEYVRTTLGAVYDYTADSGTVWFDAKDGKSRIFVMSYSSGDVGVNYTKPYGSSPAYLSTQIMPAEMDRHLELVCSEMVQQSAF